MGDNGDMSCGDIKIVIDNGSGRIKAGFNNQKHPSLIFSPIIGRPRTRYKPLYGDEVCVGNDAWGLQHHMSLSSPINHGFIDNWTDITLLWNYTFNNLGADPSEFPVLLTEPPGNSDGNRLRMCEIMFESFNIPELNVSTSGLLAIYGTGRTTGFMLDIGEGLTQCIPVVDGYLDRLAVIASDFAGEELTSYLQKMLCDMGYMLTKREERDFVRQIKEQICFCSLHPSSDQERDDLEKTYTLPDGKTLRNDLGNTITLGPERFYPAETLFNPSICNRDNMGLVELIWSSITKTKIDSRRQLMSSIILSGGTCLMEGLGARLEVELQNTAPQQARNSIKIIELEDRDLLTWQGGQIFSQGSLRPMQDNYWISKQEWIEDGASVSQRKIGQ